MTLVSAAERALDGFSSFKSSLNRADAEGVMSTEEARSFFGGRVDVAIRHLLRDTMRDFITSAGSDCQIKTAEKWREPPPCRSTWRSVDSKCFSQRTRLSRLRESLSRTRFQVGSLLLYIFFNGAIACSFAMSSFRQNVQYSHTAWSSDSGLGAVFDIQQGPNGFLWLTTSKGVVRFDGVRFQSAEEVTNGAVRDANIDAVFISSSGGVWLAARSAGLLLWKDGRLTTFTDRRCTPALKTEGITEDQDGSLWIQASAGLSQMRGSVCEEVGTESGYPGGFPAALMVDGNGTLWVKTPVGPLLSLGKGQSKFQVSPYRTGPISDRAFLHQVPDGSIWLSDDQGLRRVTGNSRLLSAGPSNSAGEKSAKLGNFAFDTSGSLWVTTNNGLERFDDVESRRAVTSARPIAQSLTLKEGLSSDAVWKILIDREGSIWVGTNSGLDCFRRDVLRKVSAYRVPEPSIVESNSGRLRFATTKGIWSKAMLVLSAIAFLLIMYQFDRQRYVTLLRVRFDERLKERTRLAHELHDTVLQTIQGSKMLADCAKTNLDDPVRTRSTLERLSVCLDRATIEARATVNSLRNSATDTEDLTSALRQVVESCVATDMQVTFSLNGIPRSMHPVGSREVFRIGREAIRNACTHSNGQLLSIELEYGRDLTLRVRDSGRGFNPTLLNSGKSGHFGIMGMRERASNLGGRLLLKTAEEQGTCLTLIVPGRVIFRMADHSFFNIFGMRWIRKGPDGPKAPSILRHDSGMEC